MEFWSRGNATILVMGPFINDVTQVGVGCVYLSDTLYEGVGKTPNLAWQWGRGVNFGLKLCDVIYECPFCHVFIQKMWDQLPSEMNK